MREQAPVLGARHPFGTLAKDAPGLNPIANRLSASIDNVSKQTISSIRNPPRPQGLGKVGS